MGMRNEYENVGDQTATKFFEFSFTNSEFDYGKKRRGFDFGIA